MISHTEMFLTALGNSLMGLSGVAAADGTEAITDALVNAGGTDSYSVGRAAGLTSAQTAAVIQVLDAPGNSALIHVQRGSGDVSLRDPGARWYVGYVIGIPTDSRSMRAV